MRRRQDPTVAASGGYHVPMAQLRVVVEQPTRGKRWVAVAADWPGLERGGKTEDEAVEKLVRYVPRYLPVAKRVRMGSELATQTDPNIVARYPGVGSTDFWGISFAPSPLDREPFDAPVFDRQVRLLRGMGRVRRDRRPRLGGAPTGCPRRRPLPRRDRPARPGDRGPRLLVARESEGRTGGTTDAKRARISP